jgi:hypothetical protein
MTVGENAKFVRIKNGVRPYGGKKLLLVSIDQTARNVTVSVDTKAGNSMVGADYRIYRIDEVEFTDPDCCCQRAECTYDPDAGCGLAPSSH